MTLEVGDRNRAETLEVTDTRWDGNGTLFVTVRELVGDHCWDLPAAKQDAMVRQFARRAIAHSDKTRQSRIIRRWYSQSTDHWTVAVSRLPR